MKCRLFSASGRRRLVPGEAAKAAEFREVHLVRAPIHQSGADRRASMSLLERVRARDRVAWERLVSLFAPTVYGWCLRAGLRPAEAAAVGAAVFAEVADSLASSEPREGGQFRHWLFAVTWLKIQDRPPQGTTAAGADATRRHAGAEPPGQPDEADEARALCRRAIELVRDEFDATAWQAFWRVFVLGEAPAAVAADLNLGVSAIYLARARILRRLREEFAALVDFGPAGAP